MGRNGGAALGGVTGLPKTYNLFTSTLLKELLKRVSEIPASMGYDAPGRFSIHGELVAVVRR